ncbi:hypothetical protein [Dehalococcoides mccartyi]|uniref:hypothetical protein n=1 Tax=Dehalococcoides mccartyi TaxID=61435 RepID=UPI00107E9D57|nr:hypothetical protein [Dehalococcoides mccartyi]QBX64098.1 hypothetical protein DhcFL2_04895 [Dehalococcoides mccartyi]
MSLIDIGIAAINRAGSLTHSLTILEASKPANDTGILDVIEVWFSLSASGVKVGTFYGSGTSYTGRDYETIGSVASGAKRTFTGLSIDVTTGDLIGVYYSGGRLEIDTSGVLPLCIVAEMLSAVLKPIVLGVSRYLFMALVQLLPQPFLHQL